MFTQVQLKGPRHNGSLSAIFEIASSFQHRFGDEETSTRVAVVTTLFDRWLAEKIILEIPRKHACILCLTKYTFCHDRNTQCLQR